MVAEVGQQLREGRGEDVHTGVDEERRRRRLDEVGDVPERVGLDGAPRDPGAGQGEGGEGVALRVEGGHLAQRETGPDVAVGGVPGLVRRGQMRSGVLEAATAAQRLGLDDRGHLERKVGAVEPLLEHLGEMAAGDDGVGHALGGQPGKLMADDRGPGARDLDHRLGAVVGVGAQPRALAARQDHGLRRRGVHRGNDRRPVRERSGRTGRGLREVRTRGSGRTGPGPREVRTRRSGRATWLSVRLLSGSAAQLARITPVAYAVSQTGRE